jgi:hypothetical protein
MSIYTTAQVIAHGQSRDWRRLTKRAWADFRRAAGITDSIPAAAQSFRLAYGVLARHHREGGDMTAVSDWRDVLVSQVTSDSQRLLDDVFGRAAVVVRHVARGDQRMSHDGFRRFARSAVSFANLSVVGQSGRSRPVEAVRDALDGRYWAGAT